MLAIQVFGEFRIVPAKRRRHVTLEMGLCKNKTRKEKVLGTSRINQVVNLGEQESCGKESKLDGEGNRRLSGIFKSFKLYTCSYKANKENHIQRMFKRYHNAT
jgi:hypothetical protein